MPVFARLRFAGNNPFRGAMDNIQDAIKGYLESLKQHGEPIPPPIEEEIIEIPI